MWIVLGILAFLATLITVILLLPVKIIIKNDEQNELILRYKFLFKTFGEDPNPDSPIVKALLSATGVERLHVKNVQKNIQSDGLKKTVSASFSMLIDLLKEVVALLKYCTVTRLHIKIRSSGDDVDDAAIHYGQCCAATYSLLNILRSFLKVRKRGCNIDLGCNFFEKSVFRYEVVLTIRTARVLGGLWRVAMAEAKRMDAKKNPQEK
ncbi:MAG: hypothetical protein J6Q30_07465 [Oscillospiraceae bacterium]|nr:hypothetical protein [Oscillospiraceae bacterium]